MTETEPAAEAERRRVLEGVASARPEHEKGVRWDITSNVLVSRFRDPRVMQTFLATLVDDNIPYAIRCQRWESTVYVGEAHRNRAFDALARVDQQIPKKNRNPVRKRFDIFFWYALIGILTFASLFPLSLRMAGAFLGLWLALGGLVDRAVLSFRWKDRYQLGVVDMLLGIGGIAAFLRMVGWPG